MGDEDLRRLEREAARGDPDAAARLARRDARFGRPASWTLSATRALDEADRASDVQFTPDGQHLLVVADKAVRLLDPATGELRGRVTPSAARAVGCAAVWEGHAGPRGMRGDEPGRVKIRLRERARAFVRAQARSRLVFGEVQARGEGGGRGVLATSLPPRSSARALHEFAGDVDAVAAGGDLAVAASGVDVRAWLAGSGGAIAWKNAFPVRALAVAGPGRRVLIVGERGASIRDLTGPDERARVATGLRLVATAALSSDGALAVTATRDAVQVWDAASGARVHEVACPEPPLRRVSLSPGGVLAASFADRVGLWHVATALPLGETAACGLPVVAAALDPTERLLVALNPIRAWTFRRTD